MIVILLLYCEYLPVYDSLDAEPRAVAKQEVIK